MDELQLLKKDWNRPTAHKKLSAADIYPMLHKKSSSIVKTLFYISIAELVFWILVNTVPYFASESYRKQLNAIYTNDTLLNALTAVSTGIILLFIYLLYKSHKAISVTDSTKTLMENILKTRKIIKYYVLYNLITISASLLLGVYYAFTQDPVVSQQFKQLNGMQLTITMLVTLLFTAIFVIAFWLFYKLIYGILIKRLNKNYNELKKTEI
ncbi:MAG: hypothetical protein ACK5NB_10400 [Flavobacteriaceae bacterium]